MNLESLSGDRLVARLDELMSSEHSIVVDSIVHLAELERRGLHVAMGHPSTFDYCVKRLRLTKGCAYRRTTCARLVTRFPAALDRLRARDLCMTTLALLRDVLTDENHRDVLARASGKTEDEVRDLVAALAPRPPQPDLVRALPVTRALAPMTAAAERPACAPPAPRVAKIEPISEELVTIRMTVKREFIADLEQAKSLLSHKLPGAKLEDIFHECLRLAISVHLKRKRGGDRPRKPTPTPSAPAALPPRTPPAAVRRAVWTRDGGKCNFTAPDGQKCCSTHQLEYHHVVPWPRGPSTVDNIELRCKIHNIYEAELDLGKAHMDKFRRNRTNREQLIEAERESVEARRTQREARPGGGRPAG
jgi:hypothetical protein